MSHKERSSSSTSGGDDDGGSKAKKGGVRICGSCHVGYIEPGDLYPRCLDCLGTEHTGLALTSGLPASTSIGAWVGRLRLRISRLPFRLPPAPPSSPLSHLRGWSSALRATLYAVALNHIRWSPPLSSFCKSFETSLRSAEPVMIFLRQRMPRCHSRKPPLAAITRGEHPSLAGQRPAPPSPKDALRARVTDRSHQFTFQLAANNIFVLANVVSKLTLLPDALPGKYAEDISKFSSTILAMSTPIAIAMARFSAWQTMIARNVWLHLSSFPEAVRKDILEGPISPDGLFGPHFQHLVKEMQTASEESEKIHHHVMAPSHSAVIFLTTNFISGGRFSTSSTCPPRQQHHIADLPSLASWLFYGLALRRSLPGSRGDSDRLGGESGGNCVGHMDGQNNTEGLFSPDCNTPAELRGDPGNPAFIPSPDESSFVRTVRSPVGKGHQRDPADGGKPGFLASLLPGSHESVRTGYPRWT
ncbi:hypothetical protein Q8A73_007316 [Channa argus]|nr:hypothetical protein Q8A73_007316 [Channa argus]